MLLELEEQRVDDDAANNLRYLLIHRESFEKPKGESYDVIILSLLEVMAVNAGLKSCFRVLLL